MTRVSISQASTASGDPLMSLTPKQKLFVDSLIRGQSQTMAARSAGYSQAPVEANRLMQKPKIHEAVAYLHRKHEKASQMTRKKVMDGMLEAISMAKLQADPGVMVNGWREIGRMCGYYAAEVRKIDINITAKRAVDKLETLSDAELLDMIDKDSDLIEGEFTEVFEGQHA
jgi:phage terminase small subunit